MSTKTSVDIATLVGEMEAPPCESVGHSIQPEYHSDGPAETYVKVTCDGCAYSTVKAYCGTLVAWIVSGGLTRCPDCAAAFSATQILGPVES